MSLNALVVIPVSIAGRLIVSSISDGLRQNSLFHINIVSYDELYDSGLSSLIEDRMFDFIIGYDFSPLKIKIDNQLEGKCICYFADDIRSKTSGPEWEKYYKYLYRDDVFTFFWDREMVKEYDFRNLYYLPQFVNFEVYRPLEIEPVYDVIFAGRFDTDIRLNTFFNFAWYAIERHYKDALSRTPYKYLIDRAWKGFIDNEDDMAKVTNEARLGFTINSQGVSSLNYRTIQTIACKRLIISDNREEADLYLGWLPIWRDYEDLKSKIRYYLSNSDAYNNVVNSCYKIGFRNHHSKENVEFMLRKSLVSHA